ncbi:3-oxoacyl-[acyl-carrier protein] reductase [Thermocatellispora tengchongensis]|uniref:3-oxoacyl-[acyl-carrier protein] reductase n=1 Tax=Thermocatellispora tengchongensis TaxID=1073253 RepID=A0A840P7J6_9ACTN|nr:SDR family NAD(P)-dependent oxidoreductase [Thermocatellispora tengchongensis]MBB5135282.1 3-oxoacyl-[acyl-carrier protein] reductase [Thermocatellispora tengchongensis]
MRLAGKKAIVTGAGGALGATIARTLAREGCDVAGLDIAPDGLAATADAVRALGREALEVKADITGFDATQTAVGEVIAAWGGVDILVNNAGGGMVRWFHEMSAEDWRRMTDVNLTSVFNVTRAVVPSMLERGGGRIVNISSIAAVRGGRLVRGATAYAAAKAGVIGLTKALAIELAEKGITVNCIAPGAQHTPGRDRDTPEQRERLLAQIPTRTLGRPEDLAESIVFFCLPSADYLTGVILPQDGGHSI